MATLERAIAIALEAHAGQKDKAGAPYILHPLRVMFRLKSDTERIAAVLHDVLEDSPWTLQDLRKEGFSEEVLTLVDLLTRRQGESYNDFIERIKPHPVARKIKLADLEDNMDLTRYNSLDEKAKERLAKYHSAWIKLTSP